MRILVVCQYYYPEQFRINDICEQLVKDGHTVSVLTGLPNYPSGKIPKEYRWGQKRKETINGVSVYRCFEIGRKKGTIGLAMNYISFMVSASLRALICKNNFDIIFVYQLSPITMALPGVILKKRTGKPLCLYCCDIWPESLKNYISDENNYIYKVVSKFSNYIYSQCDSITVAAKFFIDYFNDRHSIPLQKITYNPTHAEDIYLNMNLVEDNDIIDFVFMGNIGVIQDIDCILNATEKIKDIPNFKVHFVGDGSYLEASRQLVHKKGLDRIVEFHGWHPLEKMSDFYKKADACLLTLKDESVVGRTIPTKLPGYMAAGKPVIGAINGSAQEIIKESKCGVCVNASDFSGLAKAMKDFIQNPDKYKECGENGRRYFGENFTKTMYIEKLEKTLAELLVG